MRVGIIYIKEGVIWVSFRGVGKYLPQARNLLVFADLLGLRSSLHVLKAEKFMGTIGESEELNYCGDFDVLAERIWTIIQPSLISCDLEFYGSMKHFRFAVAGSWRVYVHSPNGEFNLES